MKREGYSIEYPDDWDGNDAKVLVNGKTELWEFLNNMQESKYQLLKNHPFLITRHFDARVKSLIKNVLMGPGGGNGHAEPAVGGPAACRYLANKAPEMMEKLDLPKKMTSFFNRPDFDVRRRSDAE